MEMITVTITSINGALFEPHKMSVKSDAIASVREYSEREGANDSNSEICKIGDPTVYGVIETREEVLADIASGTALAREVPRLFLSSRLIPGFFY